MKMRSIIVFLLSTLILGALIGCGGGGSSSGKDKKPDEQPQVEMTQKVSLASAGFIEQTISNPTIGLEGGTIELTSGPMKGLKIEVPQGATDGDVTFEIKYSDIASFTGLAEGLSVQSKIIRINVTGSDIWNESHMFNKPVIVTLPYENLDSSVMEETIRAYYLDPISSELESDGFLSMDIDENLITFATMSFSNVGELINRSASNSEISKSYSDYISVGIYAEKWTKLLEGASLNTGFLPSTNGFYIPNMGSFFHDSRGGSCKGMSVFAKYYYQKEYAPDLYSNYKDAQPTTTWLDDATAIQLAARVQHKYNWAENTLEKRQQVLSGSGFQDTMRSLVGAFLVTGKPSMISLYRRADNGTWLKGAHATLAYRVDIDTKDAIFRIYDPNHRGDNTRTIKFTLETDTHYGAWWTYLGGTTASTTHPSMIFNQFFHTGFRAGYTPESMEKFKKLADKDFAGDDRFPIFTLKKITEKESGEVLFDADDASETDEGEIGTSKSGQLKYIAKDSAVIIEGTVLGGAAQEEKVVVNNLNVLVKGDTYDFPINNSVGAGDGKFSFTLPLSSGENLIAMVASEKGHKYFEWAAFKQIIIESDYQVAALTATLTWSADKSDIDLWVKEPGGDSVGYDHRAGVNTETPYLNFDNTEGYGPEHYIALDGMYIPGSENDNLYGTYEIHANYYSDDDDDYEHDRAIRWNIAWEYLEYCEAPCEDPQLDGYWNRGSSSGSLISVGGNSQPIILNYQPGDPEDYFIGPPTPELILP